MKKYDSTVLDIKRFQSSRFTMKRLQTQIYGPYWADRQILFDMAPQLKYFNVQSHHDPRDPIDPLPIQFLSKLTNIETLSFDLNLFQNPFIIRPLFEQLSQSKTLRSLTIRDHQALDYYLEAEDVLYLVDQVKGLRVLDLSCFIEREPQGA